MHSRALEGTRTPNLLIRSQMLYPLSYERAGCVAAEWPEETLHEADPGRESEPATGILRPDATSVTA
jgi:hypothetical protein